MKLKGTDFQIKVWNEIKKIPRGSVRTYKEIAIAINHPKSYRAVANACKKNPIPIIIPCHRVIGSNGNIGGYFGKEKIFEKIKLLKDEGYEGFT
jgi:methylated-DNA-[protein]-cysteine S-methyltransferase